MKFDEFISSSREKRRMYATVKCMQYENLYEQYIDESVKGTVIYTGDLNLEYTESNIQNIKVENIDSVSAIYKYSNGKTAVLNFANFTNPGGGYLEGAAAQEECLCSESADLINILLKFNDYYKENNNHINEMNFSNRGLYIPNVIFDRDSEEEISCDVITVASPINIPFNFKNKENLISRIKFVLDIAQDQSVNTLILGAFGCGVFMQNPKIVSKIFKDFLDSGKYNFSNVIFAVYGDKNYLVFKNTFE